MAEMPTHFQERLRWADGSMTNLSEWIPIPQVSRDRLSKIAEQAALLVDPDPCRYDHHDTCQAHSLHDRPCPHEVLKELLA